MKLSIIVPCYNEEDCISVTFESIDSYLKNNTISEYEIIIVNDGSTDNSSKILDEIANANQRLKVHHQDRNYGRGLAIRKGIEISSGDILIMLDADLSYDVDHIGEILIQFSAPHYADVVVVSPYMNGGTVKGVPGKRLAISKIANWILAGFIPGNLSTVTGVVRGYRGSLLRSIPLFETGKELHLEILRKLFLKGAHVTEIPGRLVWNKSNKPRRKTNLKFVGAAQRHLLYGLLNRPTRILKYVSSILLIIGFFEFYTILISVIDHFKLTEDSFWLSVWRALAASLDQSPHTFIIGGLCLVLGFQSLTYLSLFQVMKLQQEEIMKHLIELKAPK